MTSDKAQLQAKLVESLAMLAVRVHNAIENNQTIECETTAGMKDVSKPEDIWETKAPDGSFTFTLRIGPQSDDAVDPHAQSRER